MSELFKPGTYNPPEGVYLEVGPNCEPINDARIAIIEKADILPITQSSSNKWLKI
jgi:hypothetical protein